MAWKLLHSSLLVFIVMSQTGYGLHIMSVPEPFNENFDKELNITCAPDGPALSDKYIQTIQLLLKEQTIGIVGRSGVRVGPGAMANMQIDGQIQSNTGNSFLMVTISNPRDADTGTYMCLMFYEDENFQIQEERTTADVTSDHEDFTLIASRLVDRVANLEKSFKDQEKILKQQKDLNSEQGKHLKEQKDEISRLENRLNGQVASRLSDLEVAGKTTSHLVQDLVDKESFSSAFSVSGTKSTISSGEILTFQRFEVNVGGHYNLSTGVYRAPKKGLYAFSLFLWASDADAVWIHLKRNYKVVAGLYAFDSSDSSQSSVDVVLSLDEGDKVLPYVRHGGRLSYVKEKYSVFSGYLVKLL